MTEKKKLELELIARCIRRRLIKLMPDNGIRLTKKIESAVLSGDIDAKAMMRMVIENGSL